jgi:hypothetical protein
MIFKIMLFFCLLTIFLFTPAVIGEYESWLVRGNSEAFIISALSGKKYKIRDKENMVGDNRSKNPFHDIYLDRITVKDYKNENIQDCPANNYGKNKKITLHYSRRLLYFIPLEFYKIQCKT